ncbi:MAG TPA: S8 family peptidase [Symbiobacteriaceae bacterium]|jgi:serine protease AprX|nr:S8 family peptidase [Symbiobacteriaceae bacterium]
MARQKVARFGVLASLFLLGLSLGGGPLGQTPLWPANLHPAIVALARADSRQMISVIVSKAPGAGDVEAAAARLGARVTARWPFINAFAAELPAGRAAALAQLPGVRTVVREHQASAAATRSSPSGAPQPYVASVRADALWAQGYKGAGVTVAVVDSGIFASSATSSDFGGRTLVNLSFNPATNYTIDKFGHGTHVAGIIGGDGKNSAGQYVGIAPEVNLLNLKYSLDDGTANERHLISALQWVYDNQSRYNIRVVNISSTMGAEQSYMESPTAAAVEQLWFAGVVVVVSAGNRGGESCSVCYAPASDPYVITVGAVDDAGTAALTDDFAKAWSSSGTTMDGHSKPDVMAPGAHIIAYMPNGDLRTNNPTNVVDKNYFKMGGTSMAAPVVTGVIAQLLQANPSLTPDQVKWLLQETARTYTGQPDGTPGIVDALSAFNYLQTGSPDAANQGLTPSPMLDADSGTINYSDSLWSNSLWSNSLWSNSLQY